MSSRIRPQAKPARMRLFIVAVLALAVAMTLISCSGDDPASPPDPSEGIDAYINGLGTFDDPPASNDGTHQLKSSRVDSTLEPGAGRFVCQVDDYRMDKNLHETTVFNVNDVALWPGALVRGGDLDSGLLNPIAVARAPLTVGTDLTGLPAEQGSRHVVSPNNLTVQGAVNEIVSAYIDQSGGAIGAKLSFDETYMEDFQQSMLDLGVSMSWWSWGNGSVQSDFSATHEEYETKYICRFSQAYFTASTVPPASPADVFGAGVSAADLQGSMGPDDPPCYVSSVTYGRVGFLSIYSHSTRDSVSLAVQAAFKGAGWDMDTDMNAEFERILNESEVKILVRGGDASDGVLPILGDPVQGMRNWIEAGASLQRASDAVPISYTARYLKDNRLAAFAYSNEWTVEQCEPATLFFQVAVPQLHCASADDGLWDYTLEVYYTFELQYEGFAGATMVTETIYSLPRANAVDMRGGSDHDIPDAWRNIWIPEQAGARFRLHFSVKERDAASADDTIGDFMTDWHAWPDWRSASACQFPAGFPTVGGDPATCSRHMTQDGGTDVIAYWEIRTPTPAKDW